MTVESTIPFNKQINVEEKIICAAAYDVAEKCSMRRDGGQEELAHNGGEIVRHPTIDGLIRGGENHILTAGSITCYWQLSNDVTDDHYENWKAYMEGYVPDIEISRNENNKIKMFWECQYGQDTFRELPLKWVLPADWAAMELSKGSDLLCIIRADDDPQSWSIDYRDITGEQTIEKEGGECFVIFSQRVSRGDRTLQRGNPYRLTSQSIQVNATQDTKVIRIYRD